MVTLFMSMPVPSRRDGIQYLYMFAAAVVIVAGMRAAETILNPLLLAVFLSVICAPAYFTLLRRGISQWLAILTVTGALAFVAWIVLAVVMGSIRDFTSQQAEYQKKLAVKEAVYRARFKKWKEAFQTDNAAETTSGEEIVPRDNTNAETDTSVEDSPGTNAPLDFDMTLDSSTGSQAESTGNDSQQSSDSNAGRDQYNFFDPSTVISMAVQVAGSLANLASKAVLIALMVLFILLEAGTFESKLRRAFPGRRETTKQAATMIQNVQRYVAIKTTMSLATALLMGLWLRWFDVKFIGLWMLMAFLLNFIPNVGSIAAAIPPIVIAWLDAGSDLEAGLLYELQVPLLVAAGYVVVNVCIGNLLEPRLMGRGLGLSPVIIFCSMVFWGWVLGPVGMLLSVPLTMTVHIVLNGFDDTRWIATLMGAARPGDDEIMANGHATP